MRKMIAALLLLIAAGPVAAAWRSTATVSTWFVVRPTAEMQQLRDALLWKYERSALNAVVLTAARPNITVTDVGSGNSELSISMNRTQGEAWINSYGPTICSDAATLAARAACVDAAIRADIRGIWGEYLAHLNATANPVPATPELP